MNPPLQQLRWANKDATIENSPGIASLYCCGLFTPVVDTDAHPWERNEPIQTQKASSMEASFARLRLFLFILFLEVFQIQDSRFNFLTLFPDHTGEWRRDFPG